MVTRRVSAKIGIILLVAALTIWLLISFVLPRAIRSRAAPITAIPDKAVVFYGMTDAINYARYEQMGVYDVATIVGGMTTNAQLVKDLREKGILFAYIVHHIDYRNTTKYPECATEATITQCTQTYVDALTKPYINTLNGELPGGFDAIFFNELSGYDDNSFDGKLERSVLKRIKEQFPNKLLIAWSFACITDPCVTSIGRTNDAFIAALKQYLDLIMLETYEHEGPQEKILTDREEILKKLNQKAPGILSKLVVGTMVQQTEAYRLDRDPDVDFKNFMEELIQRHIKFTIPGVVQKRGFYFYPWQQLVDYDTQRWGIKLLSHYFVQNKTTYLGEGAYKKGLAAPALTGSFIKNSSFENAATLQSDWNLPAASSVLWTDYGICYPYASRCANQPDIKITSLPRVPHLTRALRMTRAASPTVASQTVSVKPSTNYKMTAYVKSQTEPYTPTGRVVIETSSGAKIAEGTTATAFCNLYIGTGDWGTCQPRYNTFAPIMFEFNSGSNTQLVVKLSNEPTAVGTTTLWDFIELDFTHNVSSQPPPSPTVKPTLTLTPTLTPTPTPSLTVTPTPTRTPTPTPSLTLTPTLTPTPGISPSVSPTIVPSVTVAPSPTITPSIAPSVTAVVCAKKTMGDANCNNGIDIADFAIWRTEFLNRGVTKESDFNKNQRIDIADFAIWRSSYLSQ